MGVTGCAFSGQTEPCEDAVFFAQWDSISRLAEKTTGLQDLGVWFNPLTLQGDCSAMGGSLFGLGYGGSFYYRNDRVWVSDSMISDPILFFNFSMNQGDSIWIESKLSPSSTTDSENRVLKFCLILSWKAYDTCLQDTVFKFRHNYQTYILGEKLEDEIHFVTRHQGPVGWTSGLDEKYGSYLQYLKLGVGRLYFTPEELDSTEAQKQMLELIRSQNRIHCLEK